jgi:hypothetical protein
LQINVGSAEVRELIGKIHRNGLIFQAAAETGEATINWDGFFAQKPPISSPPFALDLSEVTGDDFILQPDLRFMAPNWKRQPSTIENCF